MRCNTRFLKPGVILKERYKIEEVIGAGGATRDVDSVRVCVPVGDAQREYHRGLIRFLKEVQDVVRLLPISRKYYKSLQTQFNTEQKMKVASTELETTVTCSLTKRMEDHGAIIGTKGELLGIIYRMKKGECLKLGRNAGSCQLTLKKSNISREPGVVV